MCRGWEGRGEVTAKGRRGRGGRGRVSESPASWKVGSTASGVRAGGGQGLGSPTQQSSFWADEDNSGPPTFLIQATEGTLLAGHGVPTRIKTRSARKACPPVPGAAHARPREMAVVTIVVLSLSLSLSGAAAD